MSKVKDAQKMVLLCRALLLEADIAAKNAEVACPEKAICDEWHRKVDLASDGEVDESDAVLAAWKAEGSSDRLYEACKPYYDAQAEARKALYAAEAALLAACAKGIKKHRPSPEVEGLFAMAAAGKLYRGIPSFLGPYDKLVNVCMNWSGR